VSGSDPSDTELRAAVRKWLRNVRPAVSPEIIVVHRTWDRQNFGSEHCNSTRSRLSCAPAAKADTMQTTSITPAFSAQMPAPPAANSLDGMRQIDCVSALAWTCAR
jgi:hypothetical protein